MVLPHIAPIYDSISSAQYVEMNTLLLLALERSQKNWGRCANESKLLCNYNLLVAQFFPNRGKIKLPHNWVCTNIWEFGSNGPTHNINRRARCWALPSANPCTRWWRALPPSPYLPTTRPCSPASPSSSSGRLLSDPASLGAAPWNCWSSLPGALVCTLRPASQQACLMSPGLFTLPLPLH